MSTDGLGPRADRSVEDLDPDLPVFVEIIGEDIESGVTVIHDAAYLEPPGEYVEMTLEEACEIDAGFCCDCFQTAWLETAVEDVS